MKLYIDTKTGTYGEVSNLQVIEAEADEVRMWDFMPDSEIVEIAKAHGEALT